MKLDWDIVRPELRKMSTGDLLGMVGRAYELISVEQVPYVLGRCVPLDKLSDEEARLGDRSLCEKAIQFYTDSVEGRYYESFDVNSKNCTHLSDGTETWIDEALLFFERATAASRVGSHREAREVFELLWDLFDRIDAIENIVFFADEHGSWQVWVDYRKVLPAYFASLAATIDGATFGPRVMEIIERHDRGQRNEGIAEARAAVVSEEQQQALDNAIDSERQRRRSRCR
ncbi:MAG: hypothetical protein HN348_14615 [Proteobacteria bacterium]|nr:hypothetical protein [Pseudomonadota bacterium]